MECEVHTVLFRSDADGALKDDMLLLSSSCDRGIGGRDNLRSQRGEGIEGWGQRLSEDYLSFP